MFISEPMVARRLLPFNLWSSCNLKLVCENDMACSISNLWLSCSIDLDVQEIHNIAQQIALDVMFNNRVTRVSGVYASTDYV